MTQHLALYRKYRPNGFDSLIGQEAIKTTLLNALRLGKVSHAYLFTGPRGTGKTSSAKILAKALNCLNPIEFEPCGNCDACKDSNPDILEMDAASNNGVDDIRELREKVVYTPVFGKYKVYIIDEVHMLTIQAFNALLKTLEEPPAHAVFILATTEPHKIPLTILSRCQRYDFRRIAQEDIVSRMQTIVQAENADVELGALQLIAQIAAGGMRDALSLLDQAISHAKGIVTLQGVIELTGAVDTRKIGKLIEYIGRKDVERSLEHFNTCFQSGQEPKFFIEEMMNYYRDILLYEKLGEKATLKKGVTDPSFHNVRNAVNSKLIFHHLDVLQKTMGKMKFHHDVHLLVEMAIVEMVNDKNEDMRAELILLKEEVELLKSGKGSEQIPVAVVEQQVELIEESIPSSQNVHQQEILQNNDAAIQQPIASKEEEQETRNTEIIKSLNETINPDTKMAENNSIEANQPSVPNGLAELSMEDIIVGMNDVPEFIGKENQSMERQNADNESKESTPLNEDKETEPAGIQEFTQIVEEAIEKKEDWVHLIDEDQIPPLSEEEKQQEESIPEEISLSTEERWVVDCLDSCTKEQRASYSEHAPNIQRLLKETRISTFTLFREFSLKAVSGTHLIMSHPENVKVKLMERITNRSMVESVLEEAYMPLKLVLLTDAEWKRVKNAVLQKIS